MRLHLLCSVGWALFQVLCVNHLIFSSHNPEISTSISLIFTDEETESREIRASGSENGARLWTQAVWVCGPRLAVNGGGTNKHAHQPGAGVHYPVSSFKCFSFSVKWQGCIRASLKSFLPWKAWDSASRRTKYSFPCVSPPHYCSIRKWPSREWLNVYLGLIYTILGKKVRTEAQQSSWKHVISFLLGI